MDPAGTVPQSARIESSAALKLLMPPTRLNAGIIIAVAAVLIVWVLMEKTKVGYEIKVVGFNKRAAKCTGISAMKNIVISACLSGGLSGLAGVIEVIGIQKKLIEGISSDCGYTAVLIARIPHRIIRLAYSVRRLVLRRCKSVQILCSVSLVFRQRLSVFWSDLLFYLFLAERCFIFNL